ncbi:LLM class flavin-dependent oxidoreductase [Umezawaea sp.]|uniref:LLM class flavin-dependent oxidoreductase n=1 Tax=Umezawaea sp. TaxID=1955258 RepID=UPI002ED2D991
MSASSAYGNLISTPLKAIQALFWAGVSQRGASPVTAPRYIKVEASSFSAVVGSVEIGVFTFAEPTDDPHTGQVVSARQRVRDVIELVEPADQAGLSVFGIGEHHRADFAATSPAVLLSAVAARTERIRPTSAVTVLSSADPVSVFSTSCSGTSGSWRRSARAASRTPTRCAGSSCWVRRCCPPCAPHSAEARWRAWEWTTRVWATPAWRSPGSCWAA